MTHNIGRRSLLRAGLALTSLCGCSRSSLTPTTVSTPPAQPGPDHPPLEFIALSRMAFGPRPGDMDRIRHLPGANAGQRLDAYVEEQLFPSLIDDEECEARLRRAGFVTLDKTLKELWRDHEVKLLHMEAGQSDEWQNLPYREAVEATFLRGAYSRRQLHEVLADFWHNHFNVSASQDGVNSTFIDYDLRVIRPHVLGNFRTMLEAVARSPQMLYYLNNADNMVAGPNENYARELLELHTLGACNYLGVRDPRGVPRNAQGVAVGYVDNDVYEVSRCFTGWTVDDDDSAEEGMGNSGTFRYHRPYHDRFNKLVLGQYLRSDLEDLKDGQDVLDLLAAHPGTASHICTKLCRRLVADRPPPELVDRAARVFQRAWQDPQQLRKVLSVILHSQEFRSTWGEKVKRPFEFLLSLWRGLNLEIRNVPEELVEAYEQMGQPLFVHSGPDGYPDVRGAWNTTTGLLNRWRMARSLVRQYPPVTPEGLSPRGQVEYWMTRLLGHAPRESVEILTSYRKSAGPPGLPRLVELICMSPDFQLR